MLTEKTSLFDMLKMLDSDAFIEYNYENDDINKNLNNNFYMINKYIFGCSSPDVILMFNEYVNNNVFNISSKHNELMFKLMSSIVKLDPSRKKYKWQYPKKT